MKRLSILFVLILCSFAQAAEPIQLARMNPYVAGSVAAAGGGKTCPTDETLILNQSALNADIMSVGYDASTIYVGQGSYAPAASFTMCAVSFNFSGSTGAVENYQVEVYEMSGVNIGSAPTGTCVSGAQSVPDTHNNVIKFTGMSCSLDSAKTYAITLAKSSHSSSNTQYAVIHVGSAATYSGSEMEWASNKSRADDNSFDVALDIYGFTP